MKKSSFFKIFFQFTALFIAIIVSVSCAELFLRWYYRGVLSAASGLSYFSYNSRSLFSKENNMYKLRGKPISIKHDGRYRVIVQGDSFTYGQGLFPANKRYTEILDGLVKKDDKSNNFVIFNAGVCGYNLPQHLSFSKVVRKFNPDFVLYQWFANDMKTSEERRLNASLISNENVDKFLTKNSVLYNLINIRYYQILMYAGKVLSFDDDMIEKFGKIDSEFSIKSDLLLNQLIQYYKNENIDFGIVLFPSLYGDLKNYRLDFMHKRIIDICNKYNISCLDLTEAYAHFSNKSLWVNEFDAHPGELANRIAADEIYKHFGSYWNEKRYSFKNL